MTKLSDYIFDYLYKEGYRDIFLISGGGCIHLIDSVGKSKIKYICNHHEQASAMAAESYARITGKVGLCLVTSGPGSTNTLTGLIGAWLDSIPVLFISGQIKRETIADYKKMRQLGDQEINIIDMVKPVTKYAVTVMDPNDIRFHLEKALFLAKNGRPGPVWLNIPIDVQGAFIDPTKLKLFNHSQGNLRIKIDKERLKKLVEETIIKINDSNRPVMFVGNGVRLSGAEKELLKLIKKLRIPVLTSFTGYDLVSTDNEFFFGRPGTVGQRAANFIVQNSDLLLVLGSRMNIRMIGYNFSSFARESYKIIVDIDKAELEKSTMKPDLMINYDVKDFIEEMISQLKEKSLKLNIKDWLEKSRFWNKKYPQVLDSYKTRKKFVDSYYFIETLSKYLNSDDAIAVSDGTACVAPYQALQFKQGLRVVVNSGCASMGYGLPAAIGVCFARNKRKTICIEGDGSIQLNIQELQTIVHHHLPIKIFVLNNNGYLSIKQTQKNLFNGRFVASGPESGVSLPNIIKIAKAYGIKTEKISSHKEMDKKIKKVLFSDKPVICEVLLSPDQEFLPKASSKQLPDGSFISRPLEDMYPFLSKEELKQNMIIKMFD